MLKYKVGDKILIRSDLEARYYGADCVIEEMLEYTGQVATITEIRFGDRYRINIDPYHNWTDSMFKGYAPEQYGSPFQQWEKQYAL